MSETAVTETTATEITTNDALLTGLPRSGTSLTCELLNLVDNTVALDEPMDWVSFTGGDVYASITDELACANVAAFTAGTRRSILERGIAYTKHVDGKVTGKKISDIEDKDQVRVGLSHRGEITVDKTLTPDFRLVVKQVAAFTALLETLSEHFDVYAMVRNPLAVLSSWQTVPMPIRKGHVPFGEIFDRPLAESLAAIDDPLDRQMHLLGWFFGRFHDLLPASSVLRYEDIVEQGGTPLRAISAGAENLDVTLNSRNRNKEVYKPEITKRIGARLLASDGPWWHFYSQESVQEILDELE